MSYTDDYYNKRAKAENLRARSYFKLEEIDLKFSLFKSAGAVLDLGAAPGSWSLYILKKYPGIKITGLDIKEIQPFKNDCYTYITGDVFSYQFPDNNPVFSVILSDMAPSTSGIGITDASLSEELCLQTLSICRKKLIPGGNAVMKYFQGSGSKEIKDACVKLFTEVKFFKPKSSRSNSREIFIILKHFKNFS